LADQLLLQLKHILGVRRPSPRPAGGENAGGVTLIVGLGNPGRRYADTRHNVGFQVVSRLAQQHELAFSRKQMNALVAPGRIGGSRVIVAKPQTWMNESGRAVAPLARFYKIDLHRLMVIYDDLDLPLGTLRLRPEGGSGGHKGMQSIIDKLGRRDFPRLRVGIGRPPGRMDPVDYVLQPFGREEAERVEELGTRAVAALELFIQAGIEAAMNRYNVARDA
jgi:PTH1 family peptidyl-tRNA hydrolase